MIERVFTIGVYGRTEEQFFGALAEAGIDTFCDIRQRRGVRGSQYAFVNSNRLQNSMAARGIEYRYFPELAPSKDVRASQHAFDAQRGVGKRTREELGEDFKYRYRAEILGKFDSNKFRQVFASRSRFIVFFCVEATAAACHRSLVAERLQHDWKIPIIHL